MAGVLSTVLVAGGVVGVVEATKPKGVTPASKAQGATPASINAAMTKVCWPHTTGVTLGRAAVQRDSLMPAYGLSVARMSCESRFGQEDGTLIIYFYRTAFDENDTLTSKLDFHMESEVSVGKGFIAIAFESNGPAQAGKGLGRVGNWMTKTFGVVPTIGIFHRFNQYPLQHWTDTLPPITLESFGSPKPIAYKP
jgi:hypothetical protein